MLSRIRLMLKRFLHVLGLLIGIAIFFFALWSIHHALQGHNWKEIVKHIRTLPDWKLFLALGLTVLNYFWLGMFDLMGSHYAGHPMPYGKIALPSFIGYAFQYNAGIFGGGAVRYRLYSYLGFSAMQIGKAIFLFFLTFIVGFSALVGIALSLDPSMPLAGIQSPIMLRGIGFLLCSVCVVYLMLAWSGRPLRIGQWKVQTPSLKMAVGQLTFATLDWLSAAGVLFLLLPHNSGLSFGTLLTVFTFAHIAGLVSHSPGGLGVFEASILALLPSSVPSSAILGSLLAFRAIFFLLPLLIAAVLLAMRELTQNRKHIERTAASAGTLWEAVAPNVLSIVTFLSGTVLLFSGSLPPAASRLRLLSHYVPLPVIEVSHFLGSIVGVALLFLAWGLLERLDAAYVLTSLLLLAGTVLAILKGMEIAEATGLLIVLLALLPCRRAFYRKTSLLTPRLAFRWLAGIGTILGIMVWLASFSLKHVTYTSDLWWKFALSSDVPRSLRAMTGAVVVALLLALYELFRPVMHRHRELSQEDRSRMRAIVDGAPNALPSLALSDDKSFFFSSNKRAFIMYGVTGRSWIALGNPIGPREEWKELLWRFHSLVDRYNGRMVFSHLPKGDLSTYIDLGLSMEKMGDEIRIPLQPFTLGGGVMRRLRHDVRHAEEEGCTFEVVPREQVEWSLPALRRISDAWKEEHGGAERGFCRGRFSESFLREFPVAIVKSRGIIVAFAVLLTSENREEIGIDLVRILPGEASHNVLEYLCAKIIAWGKGRKAKTLSLGLAALSGSRTKQKTDRMFEILSPFSDHFGSLAALHKFLEKFDPDREARYLACPGSFVLPTVMRDYDELSARV